MRGSKLIALAVALFVACLVFLTLSAAPFDCMANYCSISAHGLRHGLLGYFSHFILIVAKTNPTNHFHSSHGYRRQKESDTNIADLSVFKGREAKLNRAILLTLFQLGPLVIYDITKEVKKRKGCKYVKYTNVNRRVRALMEQGFLESVGSRDIQSGSQGILYRPTVRAKVAFYLSQVSPDQFIKEASDEALTTELAALLLFFETTPINPTKKYVF